MKAIMQLRSRFSALATAFALLFCAATSAPAQTAPPNKFIPMFLVYYGGGPALVASDAAKLAKFGLLDIDRFRYNAISPTTWSAIKAINPNIQIYLYEMGPESQNYMDSTPVISINGLGRHNVSLGQSHLQRRLLQPRRQSVLVPDGLRQRHLPGVLDRGSQG